jgi:hypothetical protein
MLLILIHCVLFAPATSMAMPVALGEPMIIGSWAQRFQENGVGSYNKMEAFIISGASNFEFPFKNFSVGGWSSQLVNPGYVVATGTSVTDSQFDISFTGNQGDPLSFVFLAWLDDRVLERALANWSGSSWSFTSLSADEGNYNRTAVPEPGTILLLGFGLIGLAGFSTRRKN